MPGHFTHIYTARRVADYLLTGQLPEWPQDGQAVFRYRADFCGQAMIDYPKMTAIGAIGPDLFYFNQDYNNKILGPLSNELMLALAIYYYIDAAKEHDWEPLLVILDGVSSTLAALLRFLITLQKAWDDFVEGWNQTVGPIVDDFENLADGLTGGVLSQAVTVIDELATALKGIAEEEVFTFADIFTMFDTCVQKGYDEQLFLWSDMSHYRRPAGMAQALVHQVERLMAEDARLGPKSDRGRQFLAFTLGYITHIGTDTVAHAFVNEQSGGPYRNHPQRHHLIENHIDAWNYQQAMPGGRNHADPWGATETYPELSMSALWFLVQRTKDDQGSERPDPLPDDPDQRKKALDVDGELPTWMTEAIVLAMIEAFKDHPHPRIMQGSLFQNAIDQGLVTRLFELITGAGPDKPLPQLLEGIAPKPSFDVPVGFPLPWEIGVMYRVMISFYKLSYNGNWELQKPRQPPFIIVPPESDIENLLQPPDLGGIDPSHPEDICSDIISLLQWAVKELEAAGKLLGDIVKMVNSPETYLIRLALYEAAMLVWDIVTKTHEVMAHTGFLLPHGEDVYPDNGELRLPDEIDIPLITLGGTVDSAFRAALASNLDPFGNLDHDEDVIGVGHSVNDPNYPYYPVLEYHTFNPAALPKNPAEGIEHKRPWAWPSVSEFDTGGGSTTNMTTPTETWNPSVIDPEAPSSYKPLQPGPYPVGTMPDVFFRLDAPVDPQIRSAYERAQTPWDTDRLNSVYLTRERRPLSPLGDPIPFSAHLIAQLVNDTGYSTQFNLDSDRAYAYLTWDWDRRDPKGLDGENVGILGLHYAMPIVPPQGSNDENVASWNWTQGVDPLRLHYVDPPARRSPIK